MLALFVVLLLHSLLALALSWGYFRRYQIVRPPIGVFNLRDVGWMMVGIIAIPYLYLALPVWLVGGLLGLAAVSVLYFCLEPVIANRWLRWLLVMLIGVANVAALWVWGAGSNGFYTVNNLVQVLVVVGISNLWAQSGLKARDAAILGGALAIYDVTFTSFLPLMDDLFTQVEGLPFAPLVAWSPAAGVWGALGLGDLLIAAVFPLVMRKAYGRDAGLVAFWLAPAAFVALMVLIWTGLAAATLPVMALLGPLMVGQVLLWRNRRGAECTTWQYRQAEPFPLSFALFENRSYLNE
jgi:hypothetical protein